MTKSCSELADGTFLLLHFMSLFSKKQQKVCLVGLSQSFFHYNSLARKLVHVIDWHNSVNWHLGSEFDHRTIQRQFCFRQWTFSPLHLDIIFVIGTTSL